MVLLSFGAWRRWGRFRGEENFNKRVFNEHGFDDFVEGLCAKFYADKMVATHGFPVPGGFSRVSDVNRASVAMKG